METRRDRIRKLLKGIETGDPKSVEVVNEARYIQHNPQTHEGSEGLAALFARLAKTNPRVNIVRAFEDGDFVFAHTEYDFSHRNIGFEVFRFDGDQAVEHWDNIQKRLGPNASGRGMVDGPTEATELEATEANRAVVGAYVTEVLLGRRLSAMGEFFSGDSLIQHDPHLADGVAALHAALEETLDDGSPRIAYQRNHRLLAEGNFVLSVSEGELAGAHTSFYDLHRLEGGRIGEHWNTVETIPPRSVWKNQNGKF